MSGKQAIVLDIDENLIHSVVKKKPKTQREVHEQEILKKESDFHFQLQGDQYYVFKRPGLDKFLKTVFREFDYIAFWTTGIKTYAKNILKHILNISQARSDKLIFIYTRGDCPRDANGYFKPLRKVWTTSKKFRPNNTIMMDNTLVVMRDNLQNGLLTPSYDEKNLKSDRYLPWLEAQILKHLKSTVTSSANKSPSKMTKSKSPSKTTKSKSPPKKGGKGTKTAIKSKKMTPLEFVKKFSQPK